MKRRMLLLVVGLAAAGLLLRPAAPTRAADHADGPAATADPLSDINDVYAWMTADASKLNLAMTFVRDARTTHQFPDSVQYVFHVNSKASFSASSATETLIICEFDASGEIRCWVGNDEFVGGNASDPNGVTSSSGRVRVFAGLRNDPFFFNLVGFQETARTVRSAAPGLTFDAAGCPALDAATSGVLVGMLQSTTGGPARDAFSGFNALAIVVQVDKTLVTRGGPIVGVNGTTHRKS